MDKSTLSQTQRQIRSMTRGFLLTATLEEMKREKQISLDRNDKFRADCIQEMIDES